MLRLMHTVVMDRLWVVFLSSILLAWMTLFTLALGHPAGPVLGALSPAFDADFWRSICAVTPAGEPMDRLILMWGLMAVTMMAPTAVPAIIAYRQLTKQHRMAKASVAAFVGGYLAVWLAFAVTAAVAQYALSASSLLSPHGISVSVWLTAVLLMAAGLYQFSAFKSACLSHCRAPLSFFMSHWRAGSSGAFRMGLQHGAVCVGCCWALMLLAFVGGTMNLIWMGGAMVLMLLEKLPEIGKPLTHPIGIGLILAGLMIMARAIAFF